MRLVKKSILILIIGVLCPMVGLAEDYENSVFRIKAAKDKNSADFFSQTGFVSDKYEGIVTALHGVVGQDSITAIGENQGQSFSGLYITHADIANDLAVISSFNFKNQLKHKLAVSNNYQTDPLKVYGYPLGIKAQLRSDQVNLRRRNLDYLYRFFPETMTTKDKQIFEQRKSPSKNALILILEAKLEPGHSGAPLINGDQKVVGICIGGIIGTDISFAIPWSRVDFKARSSTKPNIDNELKELARYDVSQLMTALGQLEENEPKYPKLEMRFEEDTGNFLIENKGAPMYNAEAAYTGLVSIMGYQCKMENFVSVEPTYFYHFVENSWGQDEFDTSFMRDFNSAVLWFKQLKQKVGSINKYCLNSVELEHLVKITYEDAAGGKHARYFSASKMLEDYISIKINRRISKTNKISLWEATPSEWNRGLRLKRSGTEISFWKTSSKNIAQANKYLHKYSPAPSSGIPSTPGKLKIKTK